MAVGCAVVASDLEAFAAVCNVDSDTPAGALFRNGDATDLARVLHDVVSDSGKRHALTAAGMERARDYDWDHVAAAVMRVYETVADGTKVRVS